MKAAAKITILWLCRPCRFHKGEDKAGLKSFFFYTSLFLIIHPIRSTNHKAVGVEINKTLPTVLKMTVKKKVPRPGLPYHRVCPPCCLIRPRSDTLPLSVGRHI